MSSHSRVIPPGVVAFLGGALKALPVQLDAMGSVDVTRRQVDILAHHVHPQPYEMARAGMVMADGSGPRQKDEYRAGETTVSVQASVTWAIVEDSPRR